MSASHPITTELVRHNKPALRAISGHCDEDALAPMSLCQSSHRPACNRYSIVLLSPERGTPLMAALAFALHILGAVVWVGGMFAIYACLRPALGTLEPPQRLRLMRVTFQKFFPWVCVTILLLLASGYWMVFTTFCGFAAAGLHIHLMQMVGWLMIALFVRLFHGPRLACKRAVDSEDWPSAGA